MLPDPAPAHRVDFFISYTGRDVVWTRWVASQLERAGFTTLFQEADWGGGANFVAEIHHALERSDRLVVIASEAYFESRWTEEEWTAALYQGPERVIPLRVEDCRIPGLLGPRVRGDLFGIPEDEAVRRLLSAVSPPLGRAPSTPFPGPDPGVAAFPSAVWASSAAPPRDPEFLGRDDELARLESTLDSKPALIITGPPGVGKTALAAEYFHRHADDVRFAWWTAGGNHEVLAQGLAAAAKALGLPEGANADESIAADAAVQWFGCHAGWLLVVDGVDDHSVASEVLACRGGSVIVTTTDAGWPSADPRVELSPWDRPASIAYLAARLAEGDHDRLAAELGDLPLALTQARSYIAASGISVDRYVELLTESLRGILERGATGAHRATMTAAVELALKRLSPDALALVQILSMFASAPIPTDLFASAVTMGPQILPEALAEDLAREDAFAELRSVGLVRRDGPFATMHQLVQRVVKEAVPLEQRPLLIARSGAVLASGVPMWTSRPEHWDRCAQLLPHALTMSEELEAGAMPGPSSFLLNRMGVYVEARGDPGLAVELLERAVRLAEAAGDRVATGSALNNLANAVAATGDLPRAIEHANRSLAEKRGGGARPMLIARSLGALGSLIRRSGDFASALALHREALELLESDPESGIHEIAEERNDIAYCLGELGHYEQARDMHLEALRQFEELEGDDGLEVGHTHAALGSLLAGVGLAAEALVHQRRAVEIFTTQLEAGHPDLSPLLSQLGLILMDLGQMDEARESLERAVSIIEDAYGPDHFEVGFKLGNLGLVLAQAGDLDSAIAVHRRSVELLRAGLGSEHRSVAIQLNNFGRALHIAEREQEAQETLEEAFTIALEKPIEPLLGQIVSNYLEVLLAQDDTDHRAATLDRLIARADSESEPFRSYFLAWVAGACLHLMDTERMAECMEKQVGDRLALFGPLLHPHVIAGDEAL